MNIFSRFIVIVLVLFGALAGVARADDNAVRGVDALRLIAPYQLDDGTTMAGVDMVLAPDWHTYWRQPGDSGIAPNFDWSASSNVADVTVLWPAPQRFDLPDDRTVGYADRIVWPLHVTPLDPTKPIILRLSMHYGVCKEICVPGRAELSAAKRASDDDRALIESFVARLPRALSSDESVSVAIIDTQFIVTLSGVPGTLGLIIEGPKSVWFDAPKVTRMGETLRYVMPVEIGARATLMGADMRLTFLGENDAIETSLKVQ